MTNATEDTPSADDTCAIFNGYSLPTDILWELLVVLDAQDDKPPRALCSFMRVCRRFRAIALATHSLWARHTLSPLLIAQKYDDVSREDNLIPMISMLTERAKPVLLDLRLPPGVLERFPRLMKELMPSLLKKTRSITNMHLRSAREDASFWDYLQSADTPCLNTFTVGAKHYVSTTDKYARVFPYGGSQSGTIIDTPSLRTLRLINILPPCPFPNLRTLSIKVAYFQDRKGFDKPSQNFVTYLRFLSHLARLVLYRCLIDATGDLHSQPVDVPHLQFIELTCAPSPCAFFLERVHFPAAAVFLWKDSTVTWEPVYDLRRMVDALHEHLKPVAQHSFRVSLRVSDAEGDCTSVEDDLGNYHPASRSWSTGPYIAYAIYQVDGRDAVLDTIESGDDLLVRLECKNTIQLFRNDNLSRIVQPESVTALTISSMGSRSNAFLAKYMLNVLRSFPAIKRFTWLNLTTPEKLALILTDVLDPFRTPLLQSLRICQLGHPTRSQWVGNASVIALCEELRARTEEGYALGYLPRIDKVVDLESGPEKNGYTRGQEMEPGELLNELWDMLASAQGGN